MRDFNTVREGLSTNKFQQVLDTVQVNQKAMQEKQEFHRSSRSLEVLIECRAADIHERKRDISIDDAFALAVDLEEQGLIKHDVPYVVKNTEIGGGL